MRKSILFLGAGINILLALIVLMVEGKLSPVMGTTGLVLLWIAIAVKDNKQ